MYPLDWHPHDPGRRPMMRRLSWIGFRYREMTDDEQRAYLSKTIELFERAAKRKTPRTKDTAKETAKDIAITLALAAGMAAYALPLIPAEKWKRNGGPASVEPTIEQMEYRAKYQRVRERIGNP